MAIWRCMAGPSKAAPGRAVLSRHHLRTARQPLPAAPLCHRAAADARRGAGGAARCHDGAGRAGAASALHLCRLGVVFPRVARRALALYRAVAAAGDRHRPGAGAGGVSAARGVGRALDRAVVGAAAAGSLAVERRDRHCGGAAARIGGTLSCRHGGAGAEGRLSPRSDGLARWAAGVRAGAGRPRGRGQRRGHGGRSGFAVVAQPRRLGVRAADRGLESAVQRRPGMARRSAAAAWRCSAWRCGTTRSASGWR